MTLKRAIEIADLNLYQAGKSMPPEVRDALELLKQAALFTIRSRDNYGVPQHGLLPGETLTDDPP